MLYVVGVIFMLRESFLFCCNFIYVIVKANKGRIDFICVVRCIVWRWVEVDLFVFGN